LLARQRSSAVLLSCWAACSATPSPAHFTLRVPRVSLLPWQAHIPHTAPYTHHTLQASLYIRMMRPRNHSCRSASTVAQHSRAPQPTPMGRCLARPLLPPAAPLAVNLHICPAAGPWQWQLSTAKPMSHPNLQQHTTHTPPTHRTSCKAEAPPSHPPRPSVTHPRHGCLPPSCSNGSSWVGQGRPYLYGTQQTHNTGAHTSRCTLTCQQRSTTAAAVALLATATPTTRQQHTVYPAPQYPPSQPSQSAKYGVLALQAYSGACCSLG
jgi:hypothetical protein